MVVETFKGCVGVVERDAQFGGNERLGNVSLKDLNLVQIVGPRASLNVLPAQHIS